MSPDDRLPSSPLPASPPSDAPDVRTLFEATDWRATPLGPRDAWPASLRTAVALCLGSRFPMGVWAGPELVLIYNDAYRSTLGADKHPHAFARPGREVWAEIWDAIRPSFEHVMAGGDATWTEDQALRIHRGGRDATAYFTYSLSPIPGEDGGVAGVLSAGVETTGRVWAEAMLRRSERQHAFRVRLVDALRPLDDPLRIQSEAARILGEHLGACRVHYGELDDDGAFVDIAADYHVDVPSVAGRRRLDDFGPTLMDVFRSGETLRVPDVEGDPRLTDEERAVTTGLCVGAYAVVPLIKDGAAVALLAVHHRAPHGWTDEEITLIEETADRTWAAVERARAEAARRDSEARFRAVLESAVDAAYRRDLRADTYDYMSPVIESITGLSAETFAALTTEEVLRHVHPDDLPAIRDAMRRGDVTGEGVAEYRFRHTDGRYRWLADHFTVQHGADGALLFRIGIVRDISDRKNAERALRVLNETLEEQVDERTRQVHELASALTMAEQQERRRLAQILHDDLQQMLFGVRLKLSAARDRLQRGSPASPGGADERLLDVLAAAEQRLQEASEVTRTLAVDLSPPILKSEGLRDALEWLRFQMQELHGLEVQVAAPHAFRTPEEDLRVLLFGIVRELLFNIVKHAGTDRARVELHDLGGRIRIVVEDEGGGFDVRAAAARHEGGGFGLFSVRERLGLFGGTMQVETAEGAGTRVTVEMPLRLE